jgi:hypothetical protein
MLTPKANISSNFVWIAVVWFALSFPPIMIPKFWNTWIEPSGGKYERRDDYRFRSRGNNPVAVAERLRGDGENEEFDWLILALGVVAALTLAWRFLNPLGAHLTHRRKVAIALGCALTSHLCDVVADFIVSCVVVALKPVVLGR